MTALIILAAGESARLGQPKQNLVFEDQTLLERAIETGLKSNCNPVTVILGANAELINISNKNVKLKIIHNPEWQGGMASTIRAGINEIIKIRYVDSAIIMLCDQPFVTPELLNQLLLKKVETGKPVVTCSYQGINGVPALFDRSLFGELSILDGNEGAKKIIIKYHNEAASIPFEKGSIDIDTSEDYDRLVGKR
jgi:molybdenum cofactor cytidylyltransferase